VLIRGTHLSSLAQWLYKNFDSMHAEHLINRYLSTVGSDNAFCGPSIFSLNLESDFANNDPNNEKNIQKDSFDEDEMTTSDLL
jgi:hypothetical protein